MDSFSTHGVRLFVIITVAVPGFWPEDTNPDLRHNFIASLRTDRVL
jgi:hypothetical protein